VTKLTRKQIEDHLKVMGYITLQEQDLQGIDLSGADLRGANLSGANLSGANLNKVALVDAFLLDVILIKATLAGADLTEADFSGMADLSGADLRGAMMERANLEGANLSGANLAGADLSGAYLGGANLSGANLSGANLAGANMRLALLGKAKYNKDTILAIRCQSKKLWGRVDLIILEGTEPMAHHPPIVNNRYCLILPNADNMDFCPICSPFPGCRLRGRARAEGRGARVRGGLPPCLAPTIIKLSY